MPLDGNKAVVLPFSDKINTFVTMKKFLEYVTEDILRKYGTELSRVAVVFPNKRASLFLNEYLLQNVGRTMWSPAIMTISELFSRSSSLTLGDPLALTAEAHKSFCECTGSTESLDHFWGWGQLMLSDFDDIDKNMADASAVLRNVEDIHELDDMSFLTEEQRATLRRFFSNFSGDDSELKRRFLTLWSKLEAIYNNLRQRLAAKGMAYEGMMQREVVENKAVKFDYDAYLFVGFNVVQKVEQELFKAFQREGKAHFYWDFDRYYMPTSGDVTTNEAGRYVAQLIKSFPNEFDIDNDEIYNNMADKRKQLTYVSAPTESIQARYISGWLKERDRWRDGERTAIVMCDEQLLPTAIHCFPPEVKSVNITTGYPLSQTAAASLVAQLMQLRCHGYSVADDSLRLHYVKRVLVHPYATHISKECPKLLAMLSEQRIYRPTVSLLSVDEGTTRLFNIPPDNEGAMQWLMDLLRMAAINTNDDESKDPLFKESMFRMYTLCNRLRELIANGELDIDMITLQRLMMQLVGSTTVPFHGEPAEGVQLMGILETRNLDFDHVLILSCNEGNMPRGVNDASFIPYSIRKAYGLTTVDNKVAIFAYYFYNLIQRASDVTIAYNTSTDGINTGEMSRFMLQLMVEGGFNIKHITLTSGQKLTPRKPRKIEKDDKIKDILNGIDTLSPTAINRYMRCPLQFYYNYVARIKESEDDDEEKMSGRVFGNIFHAASEIICRRLMGTGRTITASGIDELLKHKEPIERVVDEAFSLTLFNGADAANISQRYNGLQLINREVIIRYVQRLLEIDRQLAPFTIKDVERDVFHPFSITTSKGERSVNIGGRIDRIDQITDAERGCERIRIIDYKTGGRQPKKVNSLDEIFMMPPERDKHTDYFLQTMLYSIIVKNDTELNSRKLSVSPALLFIQHTQDENYDPTIEISGERVFDIAGYEADFCVSLTRIVTEMFEPNVPFSPTTDISTCASCPYRGLCGV